jgi:competence protein ComEC
MIILAGAIMIAFSPLILFYDVGFQLSFLASLGIVLVYGPLSEKFNIKNDFLELKSILLVTISAQAGVMGILVYTFETFSPISFLANLIILPIIPLIMLLGFSSVMTSFASNFLATLLVIPTQLALNLEIRVIEILAKISWSSIEIRNVGLGFLIFYYIFFLILVWFLNKK